MLALLLCLSLAQTDVELSEVENNPIPTMINFDGNQAEQEQKVST